MNLSIPKQINPMALACLEILQKSGLGKHISLGGALALALYHEYRATKDVDAWWTIDTKEEEQEKVILKLMETLKEFGEVEVRRFGDVVSVDLFEKSKICFNFQIARRSAQLRIAHLSPWDPVKLDDMDDLVASKMTALIERGMPRDFIDIYEICSQKICTIGKCWKLWKEREIKRGIENLDRKIAANAIRMHLNRIEKMRPLDSIDDNDARKQAKELRDWFKNEFTLPKI